MRWLERRRRNARLAAIAESIAAAARQDVKPSADVWRIIREHLLPEVDS